MVQKDEAPTYRREKGFNIRILMEIYMNHNKRIKLSIRWPTTRTPKFIFFKERDAKHAAYGECTLTYDPLHELARYGSFAYLGDKGRKKIYE